MSLPIPHAPATPVVFTTTGQQYRQTTSFVYLGGAITERLRLSAEIDRRICAGWMSFNRYRAEFYDGPTASLDLKTRMVNSEVVEALLYGCAMWTPLKGHYEKLRAAHHGMFLWILGACYRSRDHRILSYHLALQRTGCKSIETTMRTRRLLWAGALIRMDNRRLPRRIMWWTFKNPGRRGRGGKEEEWTGLRGRRPTAVRDWGWGRMENCGIRSRQVVGSGDGGGTHVYGRMEDGGGESS